MARDISPPTKAPSSLLNIPRGVALRIFVIIYIARYTAPKISRKDRAIATEFAILSLSLSKKESAPPSQSATTPETAIPSRIATKKAA